MYAMRKPKDSKRWPDMISVMSAVHHKSGHMAVWGITDADGLSAAIPDAVFGTSAADFANYFSACECHNGSQHLIVCNDAYRTLTSCGLWAMVKAGELRLSGTDYRGGGTPLCVVENPPTIVKVKFPGMSGEVVFCDCANWGYSLTKSYGSEEEVADMPNDASRAACLGRVFWNLTYLERFVRAYERLLSDAHLGESWRMTAGSQASYGFRRHYMTHPIDVQDGSSDEELITEALYGGRCECNVLGEVRGPVWQLDARQLYSAAAAQCRVPVEYIGDHPCIKSDLSESEWAMDCIADVTLATKQPIFPYRAIKEKDRPKTAITIWPIGKFRTVLAGPEFKLAWECGMIDEVHEIHEYRCEPVLRQWAVSMFAERQRASKAMSTVVKRIALGLYGKFAQRQREWIVDPDDIPPAGIDVGDWYTMAADDTIVRHRILDGKCMAERREGFAPQSSPAISAWITSYARLMLWRFIVTAKEAYYWDTDSVWVGRVGFDNLAAAGMIGDGLGELKIAGEYERVVFKGIKDYECEAVRTKAGVPSHADKIGEDTWTWEETTAWASHMANNEMPDGSRQLRRLRARREYRHGIVQADGSIRPHNLSDLGDAFNLSGIRL